mmetsp:Transcript_18525/g.53414  ORF Transcript_18525/g.53414 Transcript_18525/m.53414 type:complete len:100 (+) Transcript_18525:126-425(+)
MAFSGCDLQLGKSLAKSVCSKILSLDDEQPSCKLKTYQFFVHNKTPDSTGNAPRVHLTMLINMNFQQKCIRAPTNNSASVASVPFEVTIKTFCPGHCSV